jgi:hypothetical protein
MLTPDTSWFSDWPPRIRFDVHEDHDRHDQQRPVGPVLRPALDHLRHAEARPLGRVERHEQAADQVPEGDRQNGRPERQAERHRGQRPGHDRQRDQVGGEPDSEQVPRAAVPLVLGYLGDRVLLDLQRPVVHLRLGRG